MRNLLLLSSLAFGSVVATAQDTTGTAPTEAPPAVSATAQAPADTAAAEVASPSHLAAAAELLDAMQIQRTIDATIDGMLAAQLSQMPQMPAEMEGVMREFFTKYMSYDTLRDDYVGIYASVYTEKELKKLRKFYQSSIGQKMVEAAPEITTRGMTLGQEAVAEHLPELQEKIMALMQESQPGGSGHD